MTRRNTLLTILLPFLGLTMAQAANTAPPSQAPGPGAVPTGNYGGPLRPQVHFSPPTGFMNDPNGMFVDSNGTWHLYYQYNPTALIAGNQHWGHATSKDLYTWTNQPIALYPPNSTSGIFSGSAVVDKNNTSGFFNNTKDGVVAIYTLNTPTSQTQEIAYSTDGGYTFTPYAKNPVLSIGTNQFRDPKVIWYKDHWIMVVAVSTEFAISIYTSPNLINWTFASNFSYHGLLGLQYECPNMIEMPIRGTNKTAWVMYISINPGAPLGGSTGEYFVGDFNGTHFTPYDGAVRLPDFAKDNYASQWFYGTKSGEDPVSMAWASNWQYTNSVPTGSEGWRSIMSLPRRNYLDKATRIGWVLGSEPYDLSPIKDKNLLHRDNLSNDSVTIDYASTSSGSLYFRLNITYPTNSSALSTPATLAFTFKSSVSDECFKGGYYLSGDNAGALWLDRGGTKGFDNPFFTDKFSVTQASPPLASTIEGVIDRSVLEVFLDKGHFSGTSVFYPKQKLDRMIIETQNLWAGVKVEVDVWGLKGTWKA